jgi:hypothetical protein
MNNENEELNNSKVKNVKTIYEHLCKNREFPPYSAELDDIITISSFSESCYQSLSENDINKLKNAIGMDSNWKLSPIYGSSGLFRVSYYNNNYASVIIDMYKDDRVINNDEVLSPSIYIGYR